MMRILAGSRRQAVARSSWRALAASRPRASLYYNTTTTIYINMM